MSKSVAEYRSEAIRLLAGIASGVGAPAEVASRRADSYHSFRNLLQQMRAGGVDPFQVFNGDFTRQIRDNSSLKAFYENLPRDAYGNVDLSTLPNPAARLLHGAMESLRSTFPQLHIGATVPDTSGRFGGAPIHTTLSDPNVPEATRAAALRVYNALPSALRAMADPHAAPGTAARMQQLVADQMAELKRLGVNPGDVLRAAIQNPNIPPADREAIDRMLTAHHDFTRAQTADFSRASATGESIPTRVVPGPAGRLEALLGTIKDSTGVRINLDPQSRIGDMDFSAMRGTPIRLERHGAAETGTPLHASLGGDGSPPIVLTGFKPPAEIRLSEVTDEAAKGNPAANLRGTPNERQRDNGRTGVG